MNKILYLHTDGGSRGNPGPAAWGFVIKDSEGKILLERGKYIGETTNNVAEYSALIEGLKSVVDLKATEVIIKMDSELIVRQMTGKYKIKQPHLIELATQVRSLLQKFESYEFQHVLRAFNKEADRQVNIALDELQ
jgi:ribonuclease HI